LEGIKLIKDLDSKAGIAFDKGGGAILGCCRRVDGGVGVAQHFLLVIDTEGVSTEGGVGVMVFNRLASLFAFAALLLFRRGSRWFKSIIVEVPSGWWQIPVEGWGVKVVEAVSVIRQGSQVRGYCWWSKVTLFMLLRGWRW